MHRGATVLTLFPVQQRLHLFLRVFKKPLRNALAQGWVAASRDFEQELPTNLLIITQRFHVVVLISRCSLSKRPTLLCTLSPKSCNLNEAKKFFIIRLTVDFRQVLPQHVHAFAKWCGCEATSSSPRPMRPRMSFSSFQALQQTCRIPRGRFGW